MLVVGYHDAPADPKLPELPNNLLLTDQSSLPSTLSKLQPKSPSPSENDVPTNVTVNNSHIVVTMTWGQIITSIAAAVVFSLAVPCFYWVSH